MHILLIEDNLNIIKGLKYSFDKNDYNLIAKLSIQETKDYLKNNPKIDLIIFLCIIPPLCTIISQY